MNSEALAGRMAAMITRVKIQQSALGPRTLLQITGLDNETFDGIELLLPPGYFALPEAGSDGVLLQCNGTRDHKVVIAGDSTADRQADAEPGDRGISRGASRVIFRSNMTVVQDPAQIVLMAPKIFWSPDGGATLIELATAQHVHGGVVTGGGVTDPPGPTPQVTG